MVMMRLKLDEWSEAAEERQDEIESFEVEGVVVSTSVVCEWGRVLIAFKKPARRTWNERQDWSVFDNTACSKLVQRRFPVSITIIIRFPCTRNTTSNIAESPREHPLQPTNRRDRQTYLRSNPRSRTRIKRVNDHKVSEQSRLGYSRSTPKNIRPPSTLMRRKQAINAREEGGGRERWLRSSERKLTSDSQARLNALRTREPHHDRVFDSVHNGGPTAFQVVVKIPNGEHRCGGWTSNRAQHPSLRPSKAGCSIIFESPQLEGVNLHGRLDESENMAQLHRTD